MMEQQQHKTKQNKSKTNKQTNKQNHTHTPHTMLKRKVSLCLSFLFHIFFVEMTRYDKDVEPEISTFTKSYFSLGYECKVFRCINFTLLN